jgi:hypothetical protein
VHSTSQTIAGESHPAVKEQSSEEESSSVIRKLRSRLPLVVLLCALLTIIILLRGRGADAGDYATSLSAVLAKKGLTVDPHQVVWLTGKKGPFTTRPVLFIGRKSDDLGDVYYAEARTAGRSAVLDVWWLTNITRTSSAAENSLVRIGPYVAYGVQLGETYDAVTVLDTRGESKRLTAGWPFYAKIQDAITNFQDSGRLKGFGRVRFHLIQAATDLRISADASRFIVVADDERIAIDPKTNRVFTNAPKVEFQPVLKSQPGTLTWAVDTVRNVSWVGPHFVEWLEHTVFSLTDKYDRLYYSVLGAKIEPKEVYKELGLQKVTTESDKLPDITDPDLGWPPAKLSLLDPPLSSQIEGEGEWIPVVDPNFVNAYPNAPPAFYQTFIRVDPEREYVRVYVTMWDPRQVQLRIVMGTREPESATGKTGTGMVPRDPETLRHLVGAFNGGFQALHGEFGMMAEGQVYLPPKPFAATVAVYDDGRVGMGSWPGFGFSGDWDEDVANQQIPKDMISMRQNLTSVVEDGVYNPWKRWWWGAAPPWEKEQTYIHRSGICITKESFFAFFWGESMGPEELGKAMLQARCVRGMHLDMNSKHTGFEFYKPLPKGAKPDALNRKLTDAEFEGGLPDKPDVLFRARKAVTSMTPLRFPRYLSSDPRDFFYLTLKPVLPGPDVQIEGRPIAFSTSRLPRAGWPNTFARASFVEADGTRTWFVRIDPSRGVPGPLASKPSLPTLAYLSGVRSEKTSLDAEDTQLKNGNGKIVLYAVHKQIGLHFAVGTPDKDAIVLFRGPALSKIKDAATAIGVDSEGFLLYGECEQHKGSLLSTRMRQAGVTEAVALPKGARLAFLTDETAVSVNGSQKIAVDLESSMPIQADDRSAAEVIFPDTEPKPYRVWGWLQGRRFRYFPTGTPRFQMPDDGSI